MQIMTSRYDVLAATLRASEKTDIPLVGLDPAGRYFASGASDDIGIYYVIPKVARLFDLPLEMAIDAFYYPLLIFAAVVSALGFCLYLRTWTARFTAVAIVAGLSCSLINYNDVYLIAPLCTMAAVPWALWMTDQSRRWSLSIVTAFLLGVWFCCSSVLRSHAGTGPLLFTLLLLLPAMQLTWKKKTVVALTLALGYVTPQLYLHQLLSRRDAFLLEHNPGYVSRGYGHPFWHSVYCGLGFLPNQYGIAFDDSAPMKAVREVSPTTEYCSIEYGLVLKKVIGDLYQRDPEFIHRTFSAKFGVVLYYLWTYGKFGIAAAWLCRLGWRREIAFLGGLGFTALFGVLVMPEEAYLTGFIAFSAMFSVVAVGNLLDRGLNVLAERASKYAWAIQFPRLSTGLGRVALTCGMIAAVTLSTQIVDKAYAKVMSVVDRSYIDSRRTVIVRLGQEGRLDVSPTSLTQREWKNIAQAVQIKSTDQTMHLTTTDKPWEFQTEVSIPMDGAPAVYGTYEVEVQSGGITVGLMNESGSWADIAYCTTPGKHQGVLIAYVPNNKQIRVIVANAAAGASVCTIKQLTLGHCTDQAKSQASSTTAEGKATSKIR